MPYATNALSRLIDWLRLRLLVEQETLTPGVHAVLEQMVPHALRHTLARSQPPMTYLLTLARRFSDTSRCRRPPSTSKLNGRASCERYTC